MFNVCFLSRGDHAMGETHMGHNIIINPSKSENKKLRICGWQMPVHFATNVLMSMGGGRHQVMLKTKERSWLKAMWCSRRSISSRPAGESSRQLRPSAGCCFCKEHKRRTMQPELYLSRKFETEFSIFFQIPFWIQVKFKLIWLISSYLNFLFFVKQITCIWKCSVCFLVNLNAFSHHLSKKRARSGSKVWDRKIDRGWGRSGKGVDLLFRDECGHERLPPEPVTPEQRMVLDAGLSAGGQPDPFCGFRFRPQPLVQFSRAARVHF